MMKNKRNVAYQRWDTNMKRESHRGEEEVYDLIREKL